MSTTNSGTVLRPMRGFSLIEVMVAVVILATGLLALAALQGSLSRASADAKARGRVAAMLTARMEDLRLQSGGLTEGDATPETSTTDPCGDGDTTDWLDCTRAEANLGSLTVNQNVTTWSGSGTFTATTTTDPDMAQFRRITLTANWTDAANSGHTLTTRTDVSALSLVTSLVQQPDDSESGGSNPIVRQDSPVTAGVIPIALGNGQSSAASNPTPEIVGRNSQQVVVGTRFNVLTYVPELSGSAAIIQRRFENEIIKCSCTYGAGGNNLPEIYRTSQWPVIWKGTRYDLYQQASEAVAPGQAYSSGPTNNVTQSSLCQECCRDHHDSNASGVAKFDPERTVTTGESTGREKYNLNSGNVLQLVNNTTDGTYINACRVIRVDGFWRVSSDLYSRQFGLLETGAVSGVAARTGVPTVTAATAYEGFVKDYLGQYNGTSATAPANAQTLYDDAGRGLNNPATINISAATNVDPANARFLHARALYVDYLEEDAREKIVDVLADNTACPDTSTAALRAECIMPYLPFTTVNLTEIARWLASNTSVLTVNGVGVMESEPEEPSGGRTWGTGVGTANTGSSLRVSSSGAAVSNTVAVENNQAMVPRGVDPLDDSTVATDSQEFQVGGSTSSGDSFDVRVVGGDPDSDVFYTIAADSAECPNPSGDHHCGTNSTLNGASGTVRVTSYGLESSATRSVTATCSLPNGNLVSRTNNIAVPSFSNYAVGSILRNGTSDGSIGSVVGDATVSESTTINFTSINANDLITVTLTEEAGSPAYATVTQCDTKNNGNEINNVTWNKPWCPTVAGNPFNGCR